MVVGEVMGLGVRELGIELGTEGEGVGGRELGSGEREGVGVLRPAFLFELGDGERDFLLGAAANTLF